VTGRVELRLAGENGDYLRPRLRLRAWGAAPGPPPLEVPLEDATVTRREGLTVLEVPRPGGLRPPVLRLDSSTPNHLRRVSVWDELPDGTSALLGTATVFRMEIAGTTTSQDQIPIRPPSGIRLRVEIRDGDSPPLEDLRLQALVPRPVLVASLPGDTPVALYFGGGRAHLPSYDLADLLLGVPPVPAEELTALPLASVGPVVSNPSFDPSPVLAFLLHPGAPLDPRPFRHHRTLELPASREGLAALALQPADLAVLRPDLADLRVVDGQGRQWPFLLVGLGAFAPVEVSHRRETDRRGASRYTFELPAAPLPISGVSVDFTASFFARPFHLEARSPDHREPIVRTGLLERQRGRTTPVTIGTGRLRVDGLALVVGDGGDAPLEMRSARLLIQRPVLLLPAPEGLYTLLLGNPGARAPHYELERLRDTLLALPAVEITAGPLEANPRFSATARLFAGGSSSQLLLLAALALATLVLVGLTLKLARRESG